MDKFAVAALLAGLTPDGPTYKIDLMVIEAEDIHVARQRGAIDALDRNSNWGVQICVARLVPSDQENASVSNASAAPDLIDAIANAAIAGLDDYRRDGGEVHRAPGQDGGDQEAAG